MSMKSTNRWLVLASSGLLLCATLLTAQPASAKKDWTETPLTPDMYGAVQKAQRQMRSGKYQQATATIEALAASATDVPKCLAIAQATESIGSPMMEARRACLNRALQLCTNADDTILVALKARQYQFFEITRTCVGSLIGSAKTVPALYDLARKCQEVALNDIAHLAMEKAYGGIKSVPDAYTFADQCKGLGMDDLLRKCMKDMIDEGETVGDVCDVLLKFEGCKLRDQNRYGLRRALDICQTVPDMENIYETARRLNEPDVANRANYFVRRGKVIQKIKDDRANYEAQLRAWREGIDIETARQQAGLNSSGGSDSPRRDAPTSGF